MFIKNLKISKLGGEIVRDIDFVKGINLIVDETPTFQKDLQKTGNSVGKTTVLRLIDYCLGGDGENIYKDPEFKDKINTKIEDFLKKDRVLISLTLVEDLDVENSRSILIERNFLEGDEKICKINGESYLNLKEEFHPKLKDLIFDSKYDKPTFRQIVSKNIRDEKNKLLNVLKTLHPTTKYEEYESLYLFWLGIELPGFDKKQELERRKSIEKNIQSRLKKNFSFSEIIQSLRVVNKDILDLEEKRFLFIKSDSYEKDLTQLNNIKSQLNRLSTQLSQLELRKDLILESKEDLENETAKISVNKIRQIYDEAKSLIPHIQKSFDETVEFHNKMVREKINFVTQELPQLERKILSVKKKISGFLQDEKEITEKVRQIETIEQLEDIVGRLNSLHEKKGRLEEQKRNWEQSQGELKEIEEELKLINEAIGSKDNLIEERIAKFNEYFSKVSYELYKEKFILSSDQNSKGYELNLSSLEGNPGTGKKKGLIIAFDFAYIQFADSLGIRCLHFILHDQIENIHSNQITNILTEIIKEVNCQYIVPVLKDKLPNNLDLKSMTALTLSQSNRLFKLP